MVRLANEGLGRRKRRLALFAGENLEEEGHVFLVFAFDGLGKLLRHNAEQFRMRIEMRG